MINRKVSFSKEDRKTIYLDFINVYEKDGVVLFQADLKDGSEVYICSDWTHGFWEHPNDEKNTQLKNDMFIALLKKFLKMYATTPKATRNSEK